MRAALSATYVALSVTVLLFSSGIYKSTLGQVQQQFQNYQSPTLGVSIQYPSDWELVEESNDKLTFTKQEGFVGADLNVEDLDQSDTTLPEYANTRVNELKTQRPDFQLVSFEPTTISNIPAQKVVYTFEREEDGKTNKVMRIWSINEGKLYTLAYIAESSQYNRYLPSFQRMVDSFKIDNTGSTRQVQSDDRSEDDDNGGGNCDRISYPDPDICITHYPPDLDCPDIPFKNFRVTGNDPHRFDGDNDGIGCQSANGAPPPRPPPGNGNGDCDPSYPTVCIKSPPPDLNCPGVPYKNFKVIGSDPHGFDRDNDGIGCESGNRDPPPGDEPSICYFDPSDEACDPVDGGCPPGFGFNDDDRCIPTGECPDGYSRADEDETGTCYKDDELKECEDGSIRLPDDYCPPPEPEPPEPGPPVDSCGCPIGENCPDMICDPPVNQPEQEPETPIVAEEPVEEEEEDTEDTDTEEEEEEEQQEQDDPSTAWNETCRSTEDEMCPD